MMHARQHILDIIDIPDKHQDHAKRFVPKDYLHSILLSLILKPCYQIFGIRSHGSSIWQKSQVI